MYIHVSKSKFERKLSLPKKGGEVLKFTGS